MENQERDIGYDIIGAAIEVHNFLGQGMLESAYQECLTFELENRGFKVKREVSLPVIYKGITLDKGFKLDLLVNDEVVIETKVVEKLNDVHLAQLLIYLKFGNFSLGFLINFQVLKLLDGGIRRVSL